MLHPRELLAVPLTLDATLRALFGYQVDGEIDDSLLEAESIELVKLKGSRNWWKLF